MQRAGEGDTFLATAQHGMFAIDPEAAAQLMRSIEQIQESLQQRLLQIQNLKRQKIMLGNLPEARAIAKLDAQVASGDHQSADIVLWRFAEALDHVYQAIGSCVQRYEHDDEQAAQDFQRISER
ncbi:MAG: hypothetical protein JO115_18860 [Pseudonocardiales bacterium]|nr:hypothetical protein [Pseudonocardiales bacterium]